MRFFRPDQTNKVWVNLELVASFCVFESERLDKTKPWRVNFFYDGDFDNCDKFGFATEEEAAKCVERVMEASR